MKLVTQSSYHAWNIYWATCILNSGNCIIQRLYNILVPLLGNNFLRSKLLQNRICCWLNNTSIKKWTYCLNVLIILIKSCIKTNETINWKSLKLHNIGIWTCATSTHTLFFLIRSFNLYWLYWSCIIQNWNLRNPLGTAKQKWITILTFCSDNA